MSEHKQITLDVCFGTSCLLRGAQELYTGLMTYVKEHGIEQSTELKVSFCHEQCEKGPVLAVNGRVIDRCTVEKAASEIDQIIG